VPGGANQSQVGTTFTHCVRSAPDGPVRVLHQSPAALYVDVAGRCVGVVAPEAAQVPCALRLSAQVGQIMINANRNLSAYESFGVPVWPDALPDYPGPLAGFLAGLERCETPYLVTVPCDTPGFPEDLVCRLADALVRDDAEIAMAATRGSDGTVQVQPVFCLMKATLMESLVAFTQSGQRKIDRWTAQHRCVEVVFDDDAAFFNANTADELRQLQKQHGA